MGEIMTLNAADGHTFSAWCADPRTRPANAGVIIIHDSLGLTEAIRGLCEDYAALGYRAVAPALFDRIERDVVLSDDAVGHARGHALRVRLDWDATLRDVDAARNLAASAGRVGVIGFGWGGSVAWLASCRSRALQAAACYCGPQIVTFKAENPKCPIVLHFGGRDARIPLDDVGAIRAAHPDLPIIVHEGAAHGFHDASRSEYFARAATAAHARTLALLEQVLG